MIHRSKAVHAWSISWSRMSSCLPPWYVGAVSGCRVEALAWRRYCGSFSSTKSDFSLPANAYRATEEGIHLKGERTQLTCVLSVSLVGPTASPGIPNPLRRARTCISWRQFCNCIGVMIRSNIVCCCMRDSRRLCIPHPSVSLGFLFLEAAGVRR
jgi:hypothetical protein